MDSMSRTSCSLTGQVIFGACPVKTVALYLLHAKKANSDEEFSRRFDAFDNESTDDFIKRYSRTEAEPANSFRDYTEYPPAQHAPRGSRTCRERRRPAASRRNK